MKHFLIRKREALGLGIQEMAIRCRCSKKLLYLLERGGNITHPQIAAWIAKEYGLNLKEYNTIVHESHRAKRVPKPKEPKDESLLTLYRQGWFTNRAMKERSSTTI